MSDNPLDFLDEVKQDVDLASLPKEEKLSALAKLASEQRSLENEIADMEEQLKARKEALAAVSEYKIPELMNEIGVTEFRLSNGLRVSVKPFYSGKITDPEAYEWLESNNFGDLIKTDLIFSHRANESEFYQDLIKLAEELSLEYKRKTAVHPMTLNAFIKERILAGDKFPRELFNVYTGFKTKIS